MKTLGSCLVSWFKKVKTSETCHFLGPCLIFFFSTEQNLIVLSTSKPNTVQVDVVVLKCYDETNLGRLWASLKRFLCIATTWAALTWVTGWSNALELKLKKHITLLESTFKKGTYELNLLGQMINLWTFSQNPLVKIDFASLKSNSALAALINKLILWLLMFILLSFMCYDLVYHTFTQYPLFYHLMLKLTIFI